jgi:predicted transposase YbfD/YdcC
MLEFQEEELLEALPKLLAHFTVVADPRAHNVSHKLTDILTIAVCAVICGANTFIEMEQYGQGKQDKLKTFLELKNGVPSHDTFRRVFMVLDAEAWQGVFFDWTRELVLQATASPTEVMAVDGKFSRASGLHTVSVWASEHHVVLGQRQVAAKSNEITAIPELLEVLDIAGTTVTIDAAGTQKHIAWVIREHQADYVLALKANHKHLFEDVKWLFAQHDDVPHWFMSEKGHGRIETREVWLLDDLSFLTDVAAWRDLAGVARVRGTRQIKGEVSVYDRYFLTSHTDVNALAYAVRAHWGIENSLHWVLDVAFDEDANRARTDHAQANLVTLRHLALNQLKRESSLKASINAKRMRAGWDDDYLLKVLYA